MWHPLPRCQPLRACLALLLLPVGLHAGVPTAVDRLWSDFDPRADPLDVRVLHETRRDGLVVRTVLYTTEPGRGRPARIVAYYAFPEGGSHLPAVLHLHGGGQNATRGYVEHFARRGYAALSIGWGGKPLEGNPANGQSDWADLPFRQNGKDSSYVYNLTPDARANAWYHWTKAARRAITFLERQPEVDPARIGEFGVSMGAQMTWLVAGTDSRLRCAAAVFGLTRLDEVLPGIPGSEYEPLARSHPLWGQAIDSKAYAGRIRCPFLSLSAANDFHARIELVDESLGEIPGDRTWEVISPHYSHHIDGPETPALDRWMDRWLKDGPAWPAPSAIRLDLGEPDHSPAARVSAERDDEVKAVTCFYSTGLAPQSRFWRTVAARRTHGQWTAPLPLTEIEARGVLVYANVVYRSGLILSTRLASASAAQLRAGGVRPSDPPTLVIDGFREGARDWWVPEASPNVILADTDFFRVVPGPDGSAALAWSGRPPERWRFFTRKVGDPKWRGPAGAGLEFSLRCAEPNEVTVMVAENYESLPLPPRVFAATARVRGGDWETVRFALGDFHNVHGGPPLQSWEAIDVLGIVGRYAVSGGHMKLPNRELGAAWQGPPPAIAEVRWSVPPAAGQFPAGQAPLRFAFGTDSSAGVSRVRPGDSYNVVRGYGFDLGSQVQFLPRGGVVGTSGRPYFFSVKIDPGIYRVSVKLGDPDAETVATVKSETRRLMLQAVRVPAGEVRSWNFLVHVRTPRLPDGTLVRLKPREVEPILYVQWDPAARSPLIPFLELDWDEKLTLEFSDRHPALQAVEIAPAREAATVFVVGDSTATDQMMEPIGAWGQMLPRWFQPPVVIANYAECGSTATQFIAEGRWAKVLSEARPGDTILIEFGINDRRFPVAQFRRDVARMVDEARAHSALPVLVTPQNLRSGFFGPDGRGRPTLGDYPVALRRLAAERQVPLIDLNAMSVKLYEAIGPARLPAAFFDGTHHSVWGAYELARCVVQATVDDQLPFARHLTADWQPFDPAHPDAFADFHLPPDPQLDPARPGGPGAPDGRGPMAGALPAATKRSPALSHP